MFKQYIGGQWCDAVGGGEWSVINPADESVILQIPFGGAADARAALAAAEAAFGGWKAMNPYERAGILKRAAEIMRERAYEYGEKTVLESGKPLMEAAGEWIVAGNLFEWFAEEGKRSYGQIIPAARNGKRQHVIYQPIGVVGIITAWNFPAYNTARVWAAALAAGCTFVAKPSEFTPMTAHLMTAALEEAGLPAGCANLVIGDAPAIGEVFLDSPACRKIHFVGSTRVGRLLMDGASRTHTKLSLELGGNAPVLVFPDVDVEKMAPSAVSAKFRNCGQVCISPQRFLVHEAIYDRFVEIATTQTVALKWGNGLAVSSNVGPLINERQRVHVDDLVKRSIAHGARLMCGGRIPELPEKGYFYQPTVLADVTPDNPIFNEELFGPVMPITPFRTTEQAIALANQTEYGLSAYIWTQNLSNAMQVAEAIEFGIVGVNEWAPQSVEAPFGGWKASGIGAECGQDGLHEYLEQKLISYGL
ncbi:MAG: NAD-dependent succinate-semialdehyde dehydrogenase [Bacteroidetes Order II. Incertae sedis bacterium]|nr:NAD-dependent succinate-semialdehyde dehydrogenase [Bacteroidetes Order II. bacterium]